MSVLKAVPQIVISNSTAVRVEDEILQVIFNVLIRKAKVRNTKDFIRNERQKDHNNKKSELLRYSATSLQRNHLGTEKTSVVVHFPLF